MDLVNNNQERINTPNNHIGNLVIPNEILNNNSSNLFSFDQRHNNSNFQSSNNFFNLDS